MAYRAADGIAYKHGYLDLSARIIDRLRWAADSAGDPILASVAAYVRAETFFADQDLAAGLRALNNALNAAESTAVTTAHPGQMHRSVAARGALQMRAAVMAGRAGLAELASAHLREAAAAASRVPDGVYDGTAFGPASTRIHQVAVAVELGDGPAALRHAAGWEPPRTLPAERRSHYFIDLARAQLWTERRTPALESLHTARAIAPQHTGRNPLVKSTVLTLLSLDRSGSHQLRTFTTWLGSA